MSSRAPPGFYNAALNLKEYEPVALLTFDPYVLVVKSGGTEKDSDRNSVQRGPYKNSVLRDWWGFPFKRKWPNRCARP